MAKQQSIELKGRVVESLPNTMFRVELDNGIIILWNIAWKLRINNIRIMVGDYVKVEMSPYDMTKGRISYRFK